MNDDILKGKWKEMTGEVKRRWGKLTDDDLLEIKGNAEKLRGSLQKHYGYSKDEAQNEWDDFVRNYGGSKSDALRGREAID
jgi:uncharacterized protein YjbJ (UPF0337 family)